MEIHFACMRKLIADLDAKERECCSLHLEMKQLRDQMLEEKQRREQEMESLRKEFQLCQEQLSRERENAISLRKMKDEFSPLQAKCTLLEEEKAKVEKQLAVLKEELAQEREKVETLQGRMSQLEDQLSKRKEQCEVLKVQVEEMETLLESKEEGVLFASELVCELKDTKVEVEMLQHQLDELKAKEIDSDRKRRELHNTVIDIQGRIRVFCRIRPPLTHDSKLVVDLIGQDRLVLSSQRRANFKGEEVIEKIPFEFNEVYDPYCTQREVFSKVKPFIQSALDGYNVCILAYGQTGSGKTFTMEGPNRSCFDGDEQNKGVIPRSVQMIFNEIHDCCSIGWSFRCCMSCVEVYNEKIYDLISQEPVDCRDGDVWKYVMKYEVSSETEVDNCLSYVQQRRSTKRTNQNEHSSRSHFVLHFEISGVHENGRQCSGMLNLVDLAGSENSQAPKGEDQKVEGAHIRQSLLVLERVLKSLQEGSKPPFRDSQLTQILKSSLSESSKVVMFLNISPEEEHLNETKRTLQFGSMAKTVKLGRAKKN
jgi:kinesin family protein C1